MEKKGFSCNESKIVNYSRTELTSKPEHVANLAALKTSRTCDVSRRERIPFDFIRVTNGTDKYHQSNNGSRKLYVKSPPPTQT